MCFGAKCRPGSCAICMSVFCDGRLALGNLPGFHGRSSAFRKHRPGSRDHCSWPSDLASAGHGGKTENDRLYARRNSSSLLHSSCLFHIYAAVDARDRAESARQWQFVASHTTKTVRESHPLRVALFNRARLSGLFRAFLGCATMQLGGVQFEAGLARKPGTLSPFFLPLLQQPCTSKIEQINILFYL
jgi:hypothetical protein